MKIVRAMEWGVVDGVFVNHFFIWDWNRRCISRDFYLQERGNKYMRDSSFDQVWMDNLERIASHRIVGSPKIQQHLLVRVYFDFMTQAKNTDPKVKSNACTNQQQLERSLIDLPKK